VRYVHALGGCWQGNPTTDCSWRTGFGGINENRLRVRAVLENARGKVFRKS